MTKHKNLFFIFLFLLLPSNCHRNRITKEEIDSKPKRLARKNFESIAFIKIEKRLSKQFLEVQRNLKDFLSKIDSSNENLKKSQEEQERVKEKLKIERKQTDQNLILIQKRLENYQKMISEKTKLLLEKERKKLLEEKKKFIEKAKKKTSDLLLKKKLILLLAKKIAVMSSQQKALSKAKLKQSNSIKNYSPNNPQKKENPKGKLISLIKAKTTMKSPDLDMSGDLTDSEDFDNDFANSIDQVSDAENFDEIINSGPENRDAERKMEDLMYSRGEMPRITDTDEFMESGDHLPEQSDSDNFIEEKKDDQKPDPATQGQGSGNPPDEPKLSAADDPKERAKSIYTILEKQEKEETPLKNENPLYLSEEDDDFSDLGSQDESPPEENLKYQEIDDEDADYFEKDPAIAKKRKAMRLSQHYAKNSMASSKSQNSKFPQSKIKNEAERKKIDTFYKQKSAEMVKNVLNSQSKQKSDAKSLTTKTKNNN